MTETAKAVEVICDEESKNKVMSFSVLGQEKGMIFMSKWQRRAQLRGRGKSTLRKVGAVYYSLNHDIIIK